METLVAREAAMIHMVPGKDTGVVRDQPGPVLLARQHRFVQLADAHPRCQGNHNLQRHTTQDKQMGQYMGFKIRRQAQSCHLADPVGVFCAGT